MLQRVKIMSVKLRGCAVTEKGVVGGEARKVITANALSKVLAPLDNAGFEYYKDQKAFALEYIDGNGRSCYATLTLSVGVKTPNEKSKKSGGKKKPTQDQPNVVID